MNWGSGGYLYGPRWFNGEVVRVDVDSGEFTTIADGFGVPAAVKFDSQRRLHVLDTIEDYRHFGFLQSDVPVAGSTF